jgi:hypothetical protein
VRREGHENAWKCHSGQYEYDDLPRRVKVGVFAKATGSGDFEVVFDKFKLTTPLK